MSKQDIVEKARVFALAAHTALGQKRKKTGIDYIYHPADVVSILVEHVPTVTKRMLAAAWLHDVVEDTQVPMNLIYTEFGIGVARMVQGLSNPKSSAPRAERKLEAINRLRTGDEDIKTIKLADIIANTRDIIKDDPNFAPVYIAEKRQMLDEALLGGDPVLWHIADEIIKTFYKNNLTGYKSA